MITLITFLALLSTAPTYESALLLISGASCIEELSESQLEHFQILREHPIEINSATRSRLQASCLFSAFQVASLQQYISENGRILSFSELALIDGFSSAYAYALRFFVQLSPSSPIAARPSRHLQQSAIIAASLRYDNQALASTQRIRYSAQYADVLALQYSTRSTYSEQQLGFGTLSAAYYGKGVLSQLILGAFSARYGQGLLQWSGFSLSGYSSMSAFNRNGRGINISSAADAHLIGIASDFQLGSFQLSAAYSFKDNQPIGNLSYHSMKYSLGATVNRNGASLDWRWSLPNASVFGEIASTYKGNICALAGLLYAPVYGQRYIIQGRYFDAKYKEYSGLALGAELPHLFASLDLAHRLDKGESQIKSLLDYKFSIGSVGLKLRWSGRYKSADKYAIRNDLRLDAELTRDIWIFAARCNLVRCRDWGQLAYIQAGPKTQDLQLSLRLCYHNIPYWEDRIYVYQQDAPGGFNIPAFYKKGFSSSLYAAWHINRQHSLWLRLSYINERPEMKLQYRLRL